MKEVKRYYSITQMREINPHFISECGATGYVDGADFNSIVKELEGNAVKKSGCDTCNGTGKVTDSDGNKGWNCYSCEQPPIGLLVSMAIRYDHGLGVPGYYDQEIFAGQPSHSQRMESTMRTMRQLWEEVTGNGFYSPSKEAEYARLAPPLGAA